MMFSAKRQPGKLAACLGAIYSGALPIRRASESIKQGTKARQSCTPPNHLPGPALAHASGCVGSCVGLRWLMRRPVSSHPETGLFTPGISALAHVDAAPCDIIGVAS